MAQHNPSHAYMTVKADIDRRKYDEKFVPMRVICLGVLSKGTFIDLLPPYEIL